MNTSDFSPALIDKLNGLEPHLREAIRGQDHVIPRVASVQIAQRGASSSSARLEWEKLN
jgi:hypothetical protein